MRIYITSKMENLESEGWPRMQSAQIDRVLGSIAILGSGLDAGVPWIDIADEDLPKVQEVIQYTLTPPPRYITKLAFRRLFNLGERVAFDNFEANPNLGIEQKQVIRTLTKDYEMAEEVDMRDPDTKPGLQYLEACGILGAGRTQEILQQVGVE
jgi:hypothetical protein